VIRSDESNAILSVPQGMMIVLGCAKNNHRTCPMIPFDYVTS